MTNYLFYFSILVWPFGLLLKLEIPLLSQPVYLLDLVVGVLFIATLFSRQLRQSIRKNQLFLPLIIFQLSLAISLLVNSSTLTNSELITASFYLARIFVYPILYFVGVGDRIETTKVASVSFLLFLIISLFQYLFLPDLRFLKLLGFDDHYFRLAGSLLDPNLTGAILVAVSLALFYTRSGALLLVTLVSLALTFSRASYLSFAVGVLSLAIYYKKIKVFFLLAILALGIFLAPKPFGEGVNLMRTFSIFSRLSSWQTGLSLFAEKPIFGWGYSTLSSLNGQKISIDNSFIYLLATSGLIGLLSFLNLLGAIFKSIPKINKVILIALLTHSLFNNSLFFIWIFFFFWVSLNLDFKEYR